MASKRKGRIKHDSRNAKKRFFVWFFPALVLIIAILFITGNLPFGSIEKKGKSFSVRGGETRPVLDPWQFYGRARSAYMAAKKYPRVMDEVYCYCFCDNPPFKHKSLLSCFVTRHGAG